MPDIYLWQHQIVPADMDEQGHVNNLAYLRWMQDAAVAHSAAQGWDGPRYRASGAAWVVRRHAIQYERPGFEQESIVVATWVHDFRRIRSLRKYLIVRPADQTVLAQSETQWAYVAIPSLAPRRVPDDLRTAFTLVDPGPTPQDVFELVDASSF